MLMTNFNITKGKEMIGLRVEMDLVVNEIKKMIWTGRNRSFLQPKSMGSSVCFVLIIKKYQIVEYKYGFR